MNRFMLFSGVLALSACASASVAKGEISESAAKRLAQFERTGETTNCVGSRRINSITPLDEYNFLVRVGLNSYYLNQVSGCNGADSSFNRLQYKLHGGQLCRNEIIQVVDNSSGMTVGSCGLGSFERLTKKPKKAE